MIYLVENLITVIINGYRTFQCSWRNPLAEASWTVVQQTINTVLLPILLYGLRSKLTLRRRSWVWPSSTVLYYRMYCMSKREAEPHYKNCRWSSMIPKREFARLNGQNRKLASDFSIFHSRLPRVHWPCAPSTTAEEWRRIEQSFNI